MAMCGKRGETKPTAAAAAASQQCAAYLDYCGMTMSGCDIDRYVALMAY